MVFAILISYASEPETVTAEPPVYVPLAVNTIFRQSLLSFSYVVSIRVVQEPASFLDNSTLKKLHSIGYPESETIRSYFEEYRMRIENLSKLVWEETINKSGSLRGRTWEEQFRCAYSQETKQKIRKKIPSDDPLLSTALIWGASESGQREVFNYLSNKHKESENWSVIGSIVCSPLCSEKLLHHFGTGQLKEKGYGYLLRVVARNKNVGKETLKSIAEDPRLEKRYTEVAQVSLIKGNREANNQI